MKKFLLVAAVITCTNCFSAEANAQVPEIIDLLFARIDADSDGEISAVEADELQPALAKLDADENGSWSRAEFRRAFKRNRKPKAADGEEEMAEGENGAAEEGRKKRKRKKGKKKNKNPEGEAEPAIEIENE